MIFGKDDIWQWYKTSNTTIPLYFTVNNTRLKVWIANKGGRLSVLTSTLFIAVYKEV